MASCEINAQKGKTMCFCVVEIKYKSEKETVLKRIANKEDLSKEINQLEKLETVASVTVFHNHHTHRLVESWNDELYVEPSTETLKSVDIN